MILPYTARIWVQISSPCQVDLGAGLRSTRQSLTCNGSAANIYWLEFYAMQQNELLTKTWGDLWKPQMW